MRTKSLRLEREFTKLSMLLPRQRRNVFGFRYYSLCMKCRSSIKEKFEAEVGALLLLPWQRNVFGSVQQCLKSIFSIKMNLVTEFRAWICQVEWTPPSPATKYIWFSIVQPLSDSRIHHEWGLGAWFVDLPNWVHSSLIGKKKVSGSIQELLLNSKKDISGIHEPGAAWAWSMRT